MSDRKRQKIITNESLNKSLFTKFEDLPNEVILLCFTYMKFYHLYEIFYCLNQRFNQLTAYHTKMHINLHSIPSGKFLTFIFQINQLIKTTQNYILSIKANNKYKLNFILEDNLLKETFSKLKSLTLSNIDVDTIYSIIFDKTTKLYQRLERLVLLDEIREDNQYGSSGIERLCTNLISSKMKSLKYLHLNFNPYRCGADHQAYNHTNKIDLEFKQLIVGDKSLSNIETLIIGSIYCGEAGEAVIQLWFNIFIKKLLPCLPKLTNLMINAIHFNSDKYSGQRKIKLPTKNINRNIPSNLKLIKIWFDADEIKSDDEKTIRRYLRDFFLNNNSSDTTTIKRFYINDQNILENEL